MVAADSLKVWTGRCLAILLSAFLFIQAFPPLHARWLAWIALVPLLLAIRAAPRLRSAFAIAGAWGMLAAYGTTDWLPPTLQTYYGQPYWLGFGLFAVAAFLMGAVDYMFFAGWYWLAARSARVPRTMVAGAAWVVAEYFRDNLLTGNPWGLIGYSQMPLPLGGTGAGIAIAERVVQVADLGGVYAVGFVLVVANAFLAEVVAWCFSRWWRNAQRGYFTSFTVDCFCSILVVLAALSYGQWQLGSEMEYPASERVGIVQSNIELGSRWDPALYGANLANQLHLTAELLAEESVQLVVWPENAMTFFIDEEPAYQRAIGYSLDGSGVELLAGAPRHVGDDPVRYFNSAFLLAEDGGVLASYDKMHLLPFAEYFPFGSVEVLKRDFGRVREFSEGEDPDPIVSQIGRLGNLICNEAMFPSLARERVLDGAEILVNLSNDSWVASDEFAEHQFAIAAMRAVEQRRYLIRSSTSGPSAIVNPAGRVLVRTEPFTSDVLVGGVGRRNELSGYARWGDLLVAVSIGGLVLALWCGGVVRA